MNFNEFARGLSTMFPALTARECDILTRVAHGLSNADVATSLGISEKTIKNGLGPIPFKVGIANDDRGGSLRVRLTLTARGISY